MCLELWAAKKLSGWQGKDRASGQKRVRPERKDQGRFPKPVMRTQGEHEMNKLGSGIGDGHRQRAGCLAEG